MDAKAIGHCARARQGIGEAGGIGQGGVGFGTPVGNGRVEIGKIGVYSRFLPLRRMETSRKNPEMLAMTNMM